MLEIAVAEPRERPILFSGPMVPPVLADTKTQTRRALQPQPSSAIHQLFIWKDNATPDDELVKLCPYGQPGDRLWVREAWAPMTVGYAYRADAVWNASPSGRWHPSIHMPRKASRILLEVTEVRVQRLQDISEADAIAEGLTHGGDDSHAPWGVDGIASTWCDCPVTAYSALWDSINGAGSWDLNPWVWAVSFKRLKP